MYRKIAIFLSVSILPFFTVAAGESPSGGGEAEQADSNWRSGSELTGHGMVFGYGPSKVVSEDGDNDYDADEEASMIWDARLRMAVKGSYLHVLLEPYAIVPSDITKVNVAGLEANFLAPVTDSVRVGLYHHSSHNFGDGTYGFGIDLNAVALDVKALADRFGLWGESWAYDLRILSHYYFTRKGPANIFTEDTELMADEVGRTRWRIKALFDIRGGLGRSDCDISFKSSKTIPSSMSFLCSARMKFGARFFGALGEHLLAGPYVSYNRNFTRLKKFGVDAFSGGIRIDMLFQEIDWE